VIQAVITDPWWSRSGLIERLRPEDFRGSPAHATTWRAIQLLDGRNEPIDPVMVAWTAERLIADPQTAHEANLRPGLSPSDLASMRDAPLGDIHRAVTTVVRSALSHHARQARLQIRTAAAAHPTSLDNALTAAATVTSDLHQTASRLTRSTDSPISRALGGYPDPLSGGARRVQ
jgi:replicative DNA helicase